MAHCKPTKQPSFRTTIVCVLPPVALLLGVAIWFSLAGRREHVPAAPETVPLTPGFILSSPEVADGGALPKDFTGDGSGATLPLDVIYRR